MIHCPGKENALVNAHPRVWRAVAVALMVGFLAACATETDVIGLQRPVYTEEESIITVHFFPLQTEAEAYYRAIDAREYFIFTAPFRDAGELFEGIDGEPAPDEGKTLRFTEDEESTAIEQVVEFIDESGLVTIQSVVDRPTETRTSR